MKIILKTLLTITALIIVGLVIFIFVPYKKYEYVRINEGPQTITVEYVNVTGSPTCSKLYLVEGDHVSNRALLVRLPRDVPDPNRVDTIIDGKRIQLTGFQYVWQATNRITGAVTTKKTGRFDLLAWREANGKNYETKGGTSTEKFESKNYIDCMN